MTTRPRSVAVTEGVARPKAASSRAPARGRHVLSILDLVPDDVLAVCRRAHAITQLAIDPDTLRGRTVGIYFSKASTRTRTGFVVGAQRLGATTVCYTADDLQTSTGETLNDTARVLGGCLDVLVMRTNESVDDMKTFAVKGGMAVVNALSSDEHPTQAIADLATLLEQFGTLEGLSLLYCGEGNSTAAALALAVSRVPGMQLTLATPDGYGLNPGKLATARRLAAVHGASVQEIHDLDSAPPGVDVVYGSRWQEMGVGKPDPDWRRRFAPFRITEALMMRVGGSSAMFMHDLPAVRGEDVDDDVLDGPRSLAWRQAQYKLFGAMSLLEWCVSGATAGAH